MPYGADSVRHTNSDVVQARDGLRHSGLKHKKPWLQEFHGTSPASFTAMVSNSVRDERDPFDFRVLIVVLEIQQLSSEATAVACMLHLRPDQQRSL